MPSGKQDHAHCSLTPGWVIKDNSTYPLYIYFLIRKMAIMAVLTHKVSYRL